MSTKPKTILWRYIFALFVLIIAITGAHLISINASVLESGFASAINISGRQRTLSQQILFLGGSYRADLNNTETRRKLDHVIQEFKTAHQALTRGGALGLTGELSPELQEIYFSSAHHLVSLDDFVGSFIEDATRLLGDDAQAATEALERMERDGPSALLTRLNDAVSGFERQAQTAAETQRAAANLSYVMALIVIVLEILFIFLPGHRTIVAAIDKLQTALARLQQSEAQAKTAEAEAQEARKTAEQANNAKSEFLSHISHEIRTPMNGVLLSLQLAKDTKSDAERQPLLDAAAGSANALVHLMNDLLDFSKLEAGHLKINERPTNLVSIVSGVRTMMLPAAEDKGLDIEMHYPDKAEALVAITDSDRVRQIVQNFISNAVKFTHRGQISVNLDIIETNGTGTFEISVTDTGSGLSEEDQARLFTRFTQFENNQSSQRGSGLGLAISKEIVELLGGSIGAESSLGSGSRFWFKLPCTFQKERRNRVKPFIRKGKTDKYRILVAEDIAINQMLITTLLEQIGHSVQIAEDGKKAIEALASSPSAPFDLILMDNQMPNLSGLEATEQIRASNDSYKKIPIIALTADALDETRKKFERAGADGFITKPIDAAKLIEEIARVIRAAPV